MLAPPRPAALSSLFAPRSGEIRTVRVALLIFYALSSIVLLNLFIGIVTDVYVE